MAPIKRRPIQSKQMIKCLTAYMDEVGSWPKVGQDLGIPKSTLYRWLRGKRISETWIQLLNVKLPEKSRSVLF